MLVLSRKKGESIIIDDDIKVTIIETAGNQVRIGIEAPDEIEVHREEVYQQIEKENKEAAAIKIENLDNVIEVVEDKRKEEEN